MPKTVSPVSVPIASVQPKTVVPTKGSAVEKVAAATSIPGAQKPIVPPKVETKASLPPVGTTVPTSTVPTASVPPTTVQSSEDTKINDVQLAALDGILELKNIDPNLIIKEAFEINNLDTTDLPTKEMLSYQQAVLVIKYGNEKFRK